MSDKREPVAWITKNGKHIPIFADSASEDEIRKEQQIKANKKQAEEKNKGNKERTFESLIPEDSYTKYPEYQQDIEWFKKNGKRFREINPELVALYKQLNAERDKHLDPEMTKVLPKSEARYFVKDSDYPEIVKLKEQIDALHREEEALQKQIDFRNARITKMDKAFANRQREQYGRPEFKEASGDYAGF